MRNLFRWLRDLFTWERPRGEVEIDGKGYWVDGHWCETQVEVRRRLEEAGLSEPEIIRTLRDLNAQKYGDSQR